MLSALGLLTQAMAYAKAGRRDQRGRGKQIGEGTVRSRREVNTHTHTRQHTHSHTLTRVLGGRDRGWMGWFVYLFVCLLVGWDGGWFDFMGGGVCFCFVGCG